MFSYLSQTHSDHTTLGYKDILNNGLSHILVTSHIRANIYRFIYSTWLNKHYPKHTHPSHTHTYIYGCYYPTVPTAR